MEYRNDLAENDLSEATFAIALQRELKVEAHLEKVASRASPLSDIDVDLYYHLHPEEFRQPEIRQARHILVTVNEQLAENGRIVARQRIEAIARRLAKDPARFEEQALKHSECPTAMQGGLLGGVTPGKLYPELEAVLFQLAPLQISAVVESELGFHLLRCDGIQPAGNLALAKARPLIRQRLEAKGEPFQIEPGSQVVLETATLRLVARVVDMTYGEGALPESSFFEGLVLELAIWQK